MQDTKRERAGKAGKQEVHDKNLSQAVILMVRFSSLMHGLCMCCVCVCMCEFEGRVLSLFAMLYSPSAGQSQC